MVFHTGGLTGPLVPLKPLASFGWSGVGLFLVISGFSIHFRWASSPVPHHKFTRGRFFQRRFFRLYPTYIGAVAATALLQWLLGDLGPASTVPWVFQDGNAPGWLVTFSTFALAPANILAVAFVGIAWSLGLEIQLYVVYAMLIRRLRAIGVMKVVGAMLVLALGFRLASQLVTTSMPVGQFFPGGRATTLSRVLYEQLPARAFEWFLGVLAAEAFFGRVHLPRWTRSPLVAAGLIFAAAALFRYPLGVAHLNGHFFRVSDVLLDPLVGLGYFVLLMAVVTREDKIVSRSASRALFGALACVGIFSYSLYLMHPILLTFGNRVIASVPIGGTATTLLVWVFVLLAAWAFHRVIERPWITGEGDRWVLARVRRKTTTKPEPLTRS